MRLILDAEVGESWIKQGAKSAGIDCLDYNQAGEIKPSDVVVVYTLWTGGKRESRVKNRYRPAGARILCVDRPWLREVPDSVQVSWLGETGIGINGSGTFPDGDLERWRSFGIELKPWREAGEFVLVCGNKGSTYNKGSIYLTHCDDWPDMTCAQLLQKTRRPIRYKPHPKTRGQGPLAPRVKIEQVCDHKAPLVDCLAGAHAAVVYASSSATTALINGVPVFYMAPTIITKELCRHGLDRINEPFMPDNREEVFSRLSGSIWRREEIESGAMFKHFGLIA